MIQFMIRHGGMLVCAPPVPAASVVPETVCVCAPSETTLRLCVCAPSLVIACAWLACCAPVLKLIVCVCDDSSSVLPESVCVWAPPLSVLPESARVPLLSVCPLSASDPLTSVLPVRLCACAPVVLDDAVMPVVFDTAPAGDDVCPPSPAIVETALSAPPPRRPPCRLYLTL